MYVTNACGYMFPGFAVAPVPDGHDGVVLYTKNRCLECCDLYDEPLKARFNATTTTATIEQNDLILDGGSGNGNNNGYDSVITSYSL